MDANYKDGVVYKGRSQSSSDALGNIKDSVIYQGRSQSSSDALGNVKDGVIYKGRFQSSSDAIGNVKDGVVYKGRYPSDRVGKVSDFAIAGMEREYDAEIVAAYHFLLKKFL